MSKTKYSLFYEKLALQSAVATTTIKKLRIDYFTHMRLPEAILESHE
jgi:hypothetical protein